MSAGFRPRLASSCADVLDAHAAELLSDLGGVAVEDGHEVEAAAPEAAVLHQGAADLARADQRHAVVPREAEDLAKRLDQFGDGVAESALPERAEEREVLPHLRGGGAPAPGERPGTDGFDALPLKLLEEPEVE